MKITIELTEAIINVLAQEQALENAYDLSVDTDGDMNAFYKQAFKQGIYYIINNSTNNNQ